MVDISKLIGAAGKVPNMPNIAPAAYHLPDLMRNPPRIKSLAEQLAERDADRDRRNSSSTMVAHIMDQVAAFESSLDDQHEVAIHLVNFGQALSIRVQRVGYIEPAIVVFIGLNNEGEEVRLIQHVHQLSFLLWKAPRLHPEEPKRPIGFVGEPEVPETELP